MRKAKSNNFIIVIQVIIVLTLLGQYYGSANALIATSDCLPPVNSSYTGQFHQQYGASYLLSNPVHYAFTSCDAPPPAGPSQIHSFDSKVSFSVSMNGGIHWDSFFDIPAPDTTVMVRFNNQSGNTRYFDTEMLQLNISGGTLPSGVMIRESPTLASTGQTSITNIGGGNYRIDSFFDVFTELSIDGGQNWIPSQGSGHMSLPEPSSLLLLASGFIGIAFFKSKHKKVK